MTVTKDIRYIGVNDHQVDLFEGQYVVPNGMAYNSYVILDEKVAVMDTVDKNFTEEWFANLEAVLEGPSTTYVVTADKAKVYGYASTKNGSFDTIKKGKEVEVLYIQNDFAAIRYETVIAFVAMEDIVEK